MGWFVYTASKLDGADDFDVAIRELAQTLLPLGSTIEEVEGDALRIGGVTTHLTNLRKAWVEQLAQDRVPWLERTVRALVSREPMPDAVDLSRLRPSVSSQNALGLNALSAMVDGGTSGSGDVPHRAIGGDFTWTVVWDRPATMELVAAEHLETWGLPFAELLDAAKRNLAMAPFLGWDVVDGRIFAPKGVDDYDGARAFLPGQLDFLPFDEERVVFHPTRASCAVMSIDDDEAIAVAAEQALRHVGAANRVSLSPLVGYTGNWRPLRLEPNHQAYRDWSRLVTYDLAAAYETQHRLLEPLLGETVFAASYVPIEQADGALSSYCTWTRGVESLLPEVERLAFYEEGAEPFLVPWAHALEVCGHLMERTDHSPPRWRVIGFPTRTELEILRRSAM